MNAAPNNNDQTMEPISEGRASQAATAGAWLKSARQQRGLHIAALAVMLKVPQAKLEALEADRFELLPDATFARALATAMCRVLKVDPAAVLALLPRTDGSGFDVRPGLNQPFRERGTGPIDGGLLGGLSRPVVWGPALLLIAAAAVYWIPAGWLPERGDGGLVVASGAASAAPLEFVAAPAASVPATAAVAVAVAPLPTQAPEPVASAPLLVRDVAPPPAVASAASASVVLAGQALRVTATADSWVEIVDAKGLALFSRVLKQGETQAFGGTAPYKLRIGNVGGTRVEWRGAAVDLNARASNNVARLELN